MKNILLAAVLMLFCVGLTIAHSEDFRKNFEQGEVCGRLAISAIRIDAYNDICHNSRDLKNSFTAATLVFDKNSFTAGTIVLAKDKFGIDMVDFLRNSVKNIGVDITKDIFEQVQADLKKIGGCERKLAQDWKIEAFKQYSHRLQKFHHYGD